METKLKINIESQQTEESLRIALKNIQRVANIGTWLLNLNSKQLTFNDKYSRIFKNVKEINDISLHDFIQLVFPSDKELVTRTIENLIVQNAPIVLDFQIVLPDGEIRTVEMCQEISSEFKNDDEIIFGTIQDITSKKRISNNYQKLKEQYDYLFKNAMYGIYHSTVEGKILFANPTFYKIIGLPAESQNISVNLHKQGYVNSERKEELKAIFTDKNEVQGIESNWIKNNGALITIRENIRAIKNKNGNIIQYEGTIEDISEQIKAQNELIVAKEKAEKSENLKSVFLAQISHEIRTPINSLLNYADFIKYSVDIENNEDLQMCISGIHNAGNRMIRTMDLIINLSDLLNGSYNFHLTEFELFSNVIEKCYMNHLHNAKNKGLKLVLLKTTDLDIVRSDEFSLFQIFDNLIDNAIKYTKKGTITISVYQDHLKRIIVEIKDTGIGISEKFLPHIFEPFSQEETGYTRSYEGNGLGLALVKKYCELHDASINIKSSKENGSIFKITFPQMKIQNQYKLHRY